MVGCISAGEHKFPSPSSRLFFSILPTSRRSRFSGHFAFPQADGVDMGDYVFHQTRACVRLDISVIIVRGVSWTIA
jgi:hypothetical protein